MASASNFDRVELRRELRVLGCRDAGAVHDPLADARVRLALPLAGRDRVEAPVDEEPELRFAEPGEASLPGGIAVDRGSLPAERAGNGHGEERRGNEHETAWRHEDLSATGSGCAARLSPSTRRYLTPACCLPLSRTLRTSGAMRMIVRAATRTCRTLSSPRGFEGRLHARRHRPEVPHEDLRRRRRRSRSRPGRARGRALRRDRPQRRGQDDDDSHDVVDPVPRSRRGDDPRAPVRAGGEGPDRLPARGARPLQEDARAGSSSLTWRR